MEGYHKSVLLKEVIDFLEIKEGKWYIDATLGDSGHSIEVLRKGGKVLGIDVDPQSLKRSNQRLSNLDVNQDRYRLVLGNFKDLKQLVNEAGLGNAKFAGILIDLGVSSLQFEDSNRGFSFNEDAPLDMRMSPSLSVTAADLIKVLNKGEFYELFTKLADEKLAGRIAEALVSARQVKEIRTTKDLAGIVISVYQKVRKVSKIHPATKVFQALRVAVNDELNNLKSVLPQSLALLESGGRLVIISFHSLEDREVKNIIRQWSSSNLGEVLTKKPIVPDQKEMVKNPRSRSAKMRVFEKL